jgi:putative CocE/NonD family hydrolase
MRDGLRLSTDFYIPIGAEVPLPVVLCRTPYNKRRVWNAMPSLLPEQGIIYAIQDVRGRYESEGDFLACSGIDRSDGWDTVEWIAAQPWCNGSIGTMGSSYTGETAAKIAAMNHPAHKCNVIMFDGSYGGGSSRDGAFLQGGVTLLRMLFTWFRDWVPKYSLGPPQGFDREQWYSSGFADTYELQPVRQPQVDLVEHLKSLPVYSLLDRTGAAPSDFAQHMQQANDPNSDFFSNQGFLTETDDFSTPSIFVTGPLERGGSSFENFRLFKEKARTPVAREHQYLWFTPALHSAYYHCAEATQLGKRDFGDTRFPYYRTLFDWFSYWLLGTPLDLGSWPKVRHFIGNANRWAEASDWPPPGFAARRFYLYPGEGPKNGSLSWVSPTEHRPGRSFTYDPADPTPSEPPDSDLDLLGGSYAERSAIELRPDVLVYTSEALREPLTLAGPVGVEIYASSSVLDTDFAAVLSEVDGEGRSINITHGIVRMRYREGLESPVLMEPGQVYRTSIDLWHVSMQIPVGHRLRVAISSSHFPAFDRNLNTGGDNYSDSEFVVAENTIHHGRATPTALILPVDERFHDQS